MFSVSYSSYWSRWETFNATFGFSAGNPAVKRIYLQLLAEEFKDEWFVSVWRRPKPIQVLKMGLNKKTITSLLLPGTLENMCIEAMLKYKDWTYWAPKALRMIETNPEIAATEGTTFL